MMNVIPLFLFIFFLYPPIFSLFSILVHFPQLHALIEEAVLTD